MKIHTQENTLKIKDEDGTILRVVESTSYIIYPDKDKKLKDKVTGYITDSFVGVSDIADISNYEDI